MEGDRPQESAEDAIRKQLSGASDGANVRQGVYANIAVVRHTRLEFVIDFMLHVDDDKVLLSRVILSPDHARRLLKALETNIEKYEALLEQLKE